MLEMFHSVIWVVATKVNLFFGNYWCTLLHASHTKSIKTCRVGDGVDKQTLLSLLLGM